MKQKIGLAMSGGVDSTAAALILKQQYDITGFFMNLGQPDFLQQADRVKHLADAIGIDLQVIDLQDSFKDRVLDYFSSCYFSGRTPNPCIVCNREIKFGMFMDAIRQRGFSKVATGHYARVQVIDGEAALLEGIDGRKDQSYFLAGLLRDQLERVVFPLGSLLKKDIYEFVSAQGFSFSQEKESQDVCFLKGTGTTEYLEKLLTTEPEKGPIETTSGKHIGIHSGLFRYTIGQRRGLGLPDATPWYVCRIDAERNTLVVGKREELLAGSLKVLSPHWLISKHLQDGERCRVRIRYNHPGSTARIEKTGRDSFRLHFDEPQRAIAPGQFAVLYKNDRVVCSAEICPETEAEDSKK